MTNIYNLNCSLFPYVKASNAHEQFVTTYEELVLEQEH